MRNNSPQLSLKAGDNKKSTGCSKLTENCFIVVVFVSIVAIVKPIAATMGPDGLLPVKGVTDSATDNGLNLEIFCLNAVYVFHVGSQQGHFDRY